MDCRIAGSTGSHFLFFLTCQPAASISPCSHAPCSAAAAERSTACRALTSCAAAGAACCTACAVPSAAAAVSVDLADAGCAGRCSELSSAMPACRRCRQRAAGSDDCRSAQRCCAAAACAQFCAAGRSRKIGCNAPNHTVRCRDQVHKCILDRVIRLDKDYIQPSSITSRTQVHRHYRSRQRLWSQKRSMLSRSSASRACSCACALAACAHAATSFGASSVAREKQASAPRTSPRRMFSPAKNLTNCRSRSLASAAAACGAKRSNTRLVRVGKPSAPAVSQPSDRLHAADMCFKGALTYQQCCAFSTGRMACKSQAEAQQLRQRCSTSPVTRQPRSRNEVAQQIIGSFRAPTSSARLLAAAGALAGSAAGGVGSRRAAATAGRDSAAWRP